MENFKKINQELSLLNSNLSEINVFNNQQEILNINLRFTLQNKDVVVLKFIDIIEYEFYYNNKCFFYNVEDYKFFINKENNIYLSLDPNFDEDDNHLKDNDFIISKNIDIEWIH